MKYFEMHENVKIFSFLGCVSIVTSGVIYRL